MDGFCKYSGNIKVVDFLNEHVFAGIISEDDSKIFDDVINSVELINPLIS